MLKFTAAVN